MPTSGAFSDDRYVSCDIVRPSRHMRRICHPAQGAQAPQPFVKGLPDFQSAWLLLLMCAAPRTGSNHRLRSMAPSLTDKFAAAHTTKQMRLVVLGIEVGGRFSTEAASFLRLLARHRAAGIAAPLRAGAEVVLPTRLPCLSSLRW